MKRYVVRLHVRKHGATGHIWGFRDVGFDALGHAQNYIARHGGTLLQLRGKRYVLAQHPLSSRGR